MTRITPLPTPPMTNDAANFDVRADAFVESLPLFTQEANALADELNTLCEQIPLSFKQLLNESKEDLEKVKDEHNAQLSAIINEALNMINALNSLKSDQFANICNYILFSLQNFEAKLLQEQEYRAKIGHHAFFFRDSLPQGYAPAGSMLLIANYPLAYEYFKNTNKDLQKDCPLGYFALPQPNIYIKGTNDPAMVGRFEEEGLPDVNAESWTRYISRYSLRGRSGGGHDDWGARGNNENLNLARFNPIYGRTKSVEVAHNCLLEGYFVGYRR